MKVKKERQRFAIYFDGVFKGEVRAYTARQAKAWFARLRGFDAFTILMDRLVAKAIKPLRLCHGCLECGYVDPGEADRCPSCETNKTAL